MEEGSGSLLKVFRRTVSGRGLFGPGARLVAAVSGGPDSVVLLHLLSLCRQRWDLEIRVAHFDHGLRGEESAGDAGFVEALARRMGLAFHLGQGDVKGFASSRGMGVQEAARVLRYDFLSELRAATGSSHIATGHIADDQAEEVLLRLVRGAGLDGLSGIPWVRDGCIVRPLLGFSRSEILAHIEAFGLEYRTDSSNGALRYLRNRIRHEVLPLLRERFNPAITRTLNRTASLLAEELEVLDALAAGAFDQAADPGCPAGDVLLSVGSLAVHPGAVRRRIYRMAVQRLGGMDGRLRHEHLCAVDRLVLGRYPGAEYLLPGGVAVRRRYDRVLFSPTAGAVRGPSPRRRESISVDGPGLWPVPWGEGHVEIVLVPAPAGIDAIQAGHFPRPLWLNPNAVAFPLEIRTRRPGELFQPFGSGRRQRLKKFLISRRVPREVRDVLPLLASRDEVLAVAGLEIAHSCRLVVAGGDAFSLRWHRPG